MSTVLDQSATDRLRTTMAAVRVSISWFGTRKSLTVEQKAEAAEPFNAEAKFLSAGKKLLDISHPAFKSVTAVKGKVVAYWKSMSLPYPEPGVRLIKQGRIDEFAEKMQEFQQELAEAVQALDRCWRRPDIGPFRRPDDRLAGSGRWRSDTLSMRGSPKTFCRFLDRIAELDIIMKVAPRPHA